MARKSATQSASHSDLVDQEAPAGKPRFRVVIKGYPVTGFVDTIREIDEETGDEIKRKVVLPKLPVAWHYRRPAKDLDSDVPDGWFTEAQIKSFGLSKVPEGFRKRKRVRSDLTSALFEGAVVEAETEGMAREAFAKQYGVNDTRGKNWVVKKAAPDDQVGPFGPKKIRGLLSV